MGNEKLNKKRQDRISRRQYLTDRFLTHFVYAMVFSIYVIGFEMATAANHAKFASNMRFWTFLGGLAIALIIAFLPTFIKKMKTGWWWRTSVYFFAFLGGLHGVITLWYKIDMAINNVGDEWKAWAWSHAVIWIGFLVSGIVYWIEYKRVGKNLERR